MITTFTIRPARDRSRRPRGRYLRRAGLIAAVALALGLSAGLLPVGAGVARADTTFFTTRAVLAELFPKSERVTFRTFSLSPTVRARIERRLGYALAKDRYTIFEAHTGDLLDGYALVDEELGQHQPITFATRISPRAVVERVEIMVYREPRGDEVRDARFRAQFAGKTARSALRLRQDLDAVSGATISSASIATGVKRAAILIEELALLGTSDPGHAHQAPDPAAQARPPAAARPASVGQSLAHS